MKFRKVGIDFHGVLNTNPHFFKEFFDILYSKDCSVYVISGGPRRMIEDFLNNHDLSYAKIWCIFDYFDARQEVKFLADGSFYVDDEAWNAAKANYCRQNNIDVQIDDSSIYGKYFTTPYCLYNGYLKQGKLGNNIIDFSQSAFDVLMQLENICS